MNTLLVIVILGVAFLMVLVLVIGLCKCADDGDEYDNTPRF